MFGPMELLNRLTSPSLPVRYLALQDNLDLGLGIF